MGIIPDIAVASEVVIHLQYPMMHVEGFACSFQELFILRMFQFDTFVKFIA